MGIWLKLPLSFWIKKPSLFFVSLKWVEVLGFFFSLEWSELLTVLLTCCVSRKIVCLIHWSWLDVTNSYQLHDMSRVWEEFSLQILYFRDAEKLKELQIWLRDFCLWGVLCFTRSLLDPFHSSHHLCYVPDMFWSSLSIVIFLHIQVITGWLLCIFLSD